MYVTRPISGYRKFPDTLSLPPSEGPNSSVLVIQDEDAEAEATCCFGLCKDRKIRELPVPQNKMITIHYTSGSGENRTTHTDYVYLIPVLNQPLSSNRYYAIQAKGKRTGEAHTCSTEEDMTTCCFSNCVKDVKSRPLDPDNIYQQFEIVLSQRGCSMGFHALSVASDGFPPYFLRRKGWEIYTSTPKYFTLDDAPGLDAALRSRLSDFGFPASCKSSESVVVGKWYCPFMFIKEGTTLKDQVKRSMYYTMTLEQRWEQIYGCENAIGGGNSVAVEADVRSEVIMIGGLEAVSDGKHGADGAIWFRSFDEVGGGGEVSVGLHSAIVERMKWEERRFGWNGGEEKEARVMKVEEYKGGAGWRSFGCYVLVERFVLKRMDGSLVLTYDFKHTHQMRSKWE